MHTIDRVFIVKCESSDLLLRFIFDTGIPEARLLSCGSIYFHASFRNLDELSRFCAELGRIGAAGIYEYYLLERLA
jgi:hypothetical protein